MEAVEQYVSPGSVCLNLQATLSCRNWGIRTQLEYLDQRVRCDSAPSYCVEATSSRILDSRTAAVVYLEGTDLDVACYNVSPMCSSWRSSGHICEPGMIFHGGGPADIDLPASPGPLLLEVLRGFCLV